MKVFLDDIRIPQDEDWVVVRTANQAIDLLRTGKVKVISLDHDLGENQPTGYDVINWIEKEVFLNGFEAPEMRIHSANAVGIQNMERGIQSIQRRNQSCR